MMPRGRIMPMPISMSRYVLPRAARGYDLMTMAAADMSYFIAGDKRHGAASPSAYA